MNKYEFIAEYSHEYGVTRAEAEQICDTVFELLAKKVIEEDKVYLFGFGTFRKKKRKAMKIGNLQGGEALVLPETTKIAFDPSKQLEDALAESTT